MTESGPDKMTSTDQAFKDVTGDSSQHASSSDTTMLVESDVTGNSGAYEEIALDMASLDTGPLIFSHDIPILESPSECTTVSTISTLTAVPLDNKYRYHIFFAYHASDASWVQWLSERLEDEPYCYKCCRWDRDMDDLASRTQQILCSIMLSHRVVVVLSPLFIEESWSEYEDSLAHLTSLTLRKRRVVPVVLKPCELPEYLRTQHTLEVDHADFFDSLLHAICLDGMTHSDSVHTIRSLQSPHSTGFHNGQLLARLSASIEGQLKARLVFDHEEIPDTLISNDVSFTRQEFREVVRLVGRHDAGENLSWLFTSLPTIILSIIFCLWCIAFILVIVFYPDNHSSTLPVRLCVFSLPAIFIVLGCVLRWRKVKLLKEKYSICMFSRSIYVNKMFYERRKPVILTTARTHDSTFHIYFLYFNITECVEHIKSTLSHCSDDDLVNLSKLIEMYTSHSGYLEGRSMAERLAVMMASAYAIQWIFKRVQHSLEQRHTRHRQCVCQFVEEFLTAYLPCLRDQQVDLCNLSATFLKYLNCQLKADELILRSLGITHSLA